MVPTDSGIALTPGAGRPAAFWSGEEFVWKVTGAHSDGVVDIGEMVVQPGSAVPEHIHHRNDEAFYVREGQFRVTGAGQTHNRAPGAFVFVPRGVQHHWMNAGTARARILLTVTPGGMDGYFSEMDPLLRGPMDLDKIRPVCEKYGYELVGSVPERP